MFIVEPDPTQQHTLSVGLLWIRDRPAAETSTWQLTRDEYPSPQRDSNLQSQQRSGRRPTPETMRPPGSAYVLITTY